MRYRVLSTWTITVWAVLIVSVGAGMAVWLLFAYTGGNAEINGVQLDAIRTAGTIVIGTGGAAALLLAARRQRSIEIALWQTDREQVTDLYAKAVEQLGAEKAPVRLGGLYALERLAQDHVEQRQTIVNVLCAYLRMPYILPGDPPADDADDAVFTRYQERVQEREVRLAAQRILADHLRPGHSPVKPVETFWVNIDLDLTGAILIDLNLDHCIIGDARFTRADFTGATGFRNAAFTGEASFDNARFARVTGFVGATFTGQASFYEATFKGEARFGGATFNSAARFAMSAFDGPARFGKATFDGDTWFHLADFRDDADFGEATLPSTRLVDSSTPSPWTDFTGAQFPAKKVPPEVEGFM